MFLFQVLEVKVTLGIKTDAFHFPIHMAARENGPVSTPLTKLQSTVYYFVLLIHLGNPTTPIAISKILMEKLLTSSLSLIL